MQYAIIKDSIVISTCDFEPCPDDLASRGEFSVPVETEVTIGYTYENEVFTAPIPIAPTNESLLASIRIRRDSLLSASDPLMLSDYPTGSLTREQWLAKVLAYRQALRDLPETCDIDNPIYPNL